MDWFYKSSDPLWETIIAGILMFVAIIIITRLIGLRSFAKFSVFDFAFTVTIGSAIANVLTTSTSVVRGVFSIMVVLSITALISHFQRKWKTLNNIISNQPILLMKGNKILHDNLESARITVDQLHAKLREANVLNYDQVQAVVLETTGDISVLHSSNKEITELHPDILKGVREV